jgi:hypothetical protein
VSNPAHTPLPWKPSDSGTGIWSAGEPLGKNKIIGICSCDAVSRPKDENTANTAFIIRACNSHYELLKALEDAFTLLDRISDTLHYEDGLPVTALEARDIEIIYGDAVTELARFETLIRGARGQP